MRKLLISLVLSLGTSMSLMARDVLYLKNGSAIKGELVEFNVGENVKIETADGSLFVFDAEQVSKIERETTNQPLAENDEVNNEENEVDRRFRHKGYRGFVDVGGFGGFEGSSFDESYAFMFSTSHGYQINPWVFVGAGVGLNVCSYIYSYDISTGYYGYYDHFEVKGNDIFIPFFFDVKVYPIGKRKITPLLGTKYGYAINIEENSSGDVRGGVYFQLSTGVSVAFKPNLGVYACLGLDYQLRKDERKYDGISLRTGIDF